MERDNFNTTVFRLSRNPAMFGLNVYLCSIDATQGGDVITHAVKRQPVFEKIEQGERLDPFIILRDSEAQNLMDELYRCGVRPTDAPSVSGELKATKYHLEDMRKLAKVDR